MIVPTNRALVAFIDRNGGRAKVARLIGVKYARLDHAYTGRRSVSVALATAIEVATGGKVTRAELRPDLFGPLPAKRRKAA